MITKICKICGKEFETKSNRACYCSDECRKKGEKISKQKRNKRYYQKNKDYDYNKHNREKIEDLKQQLYLLNDGYNSTLKINYQTKELEEAYGSKEAEKQSHKYDTKSKQCKKEWKKAEERLKPIF